MSNVNGSNTRWWQGWGSGGLCERDKRNARQLNIWGLVFGVVFTAAILVVGPAPGGLEATPTWWLVLAVAPVIPGVLAIRAYMRFLQEADELIRKIHLEALAAGFLVAFFLGVCFMLSAQIVGKWDKSGALTWFAMLLAYQINFFRAWKHYNV